MDKKVMKCTPENVKDFSNMVKDWPELHGLLKDLHKAGYIKGLRDVKITIESNKNEGVMGVGAARTENAPKAV